MENRQIKQLVKMQKTFSRLYSKTGLVAVDSEGVHIQEDDFATLLDEHSLHRVFNRGTKEYPFQAELYVDGVLFFTVGTAAEFEAVGIPVDA